MKEDTTMKKYISPITEIIMSNLSSPVLIDSNPNNGMGQEDALNQGFFDDLEDSYPPKDKGLWDDAYNDDKNK